MGYLRRCRQSLGNYRDLRSYLPIQRRKPVHLDLQFVVKRLTTETAGLLSSRELKEHGPKNLRQVWFPACRLRGGYSDGESRLSKVALE